MATLHHFLIDFQKIPRKVHNFMRKVKEQGIVSENFTRERGIIFGNLTPGPGASSDSLVFALCMFEDQVLPLRRY